MKEHAGGVKLTPAQRPGSGLGCESPGRIPSPDPFPLLTAKDIQRAEFGPCSNQGAQTRPQPDARVSPASPYLTVVAPARREGWRADRGFGSGPRSPGALPQPQLARRPPSLGPRAQARGKRGFPAPASAPSAPRRTAAGELWGAAARTARRTWERTEPPSGRASSPPPDATRRGRGGQRREKCAGRMSLLAGCGDRPSAKRAVAQGEARPELGAHAGRCGPAPPALASGCVR